MGTLTQQGNTIIYQTYGERAELCPFGPNRIRFRSSANVRIQDQDWNLLEQPETECSIELTKEKAVLKNGKLTAEILNDGAVTYFNESGEVLLEEQPIYEKHLTAYQHHSREYRHVAGDNYRTNVYFKAYEGEHLYGLGQHPNDCFDLKGTTTVLEQRNTYVTLPFLLSSRGYGFLWNNPAIGRVETVKNHTLWVLDAAPQVDYVVMTEDTPLQIVQQVSELTGYAPAFPQWASGFWQCKLRYENQEELLAVARGYKERGIPLSAIVIDFFHWTEQGEWKFNPVKWPDPKAMVEELKQMGITLIVSVWPSVSRSSENFDMLANNNELLRSEYGTVSLCEHDEGMGIIDTTNPQTRKDVWAIIKKNYYDLGIKNFWLDVAEPEIRPNDFENMRMYIGNGLQAAQIYPYYYDKMFYDGLKEAGETEIISLSRSAWLGSQKQGTLLWSGDIPSTFESLRCQIKAGMNVSLCGIPWWNTDIGGFMGGLPSDPKFRELLVRWFQFGLFTPVMRLHGYRLWEDGVEHTDGVCVLGADNEIWSYGEDVYAKLRAMIDDRETLRPYIMENMAKASSDGTPVMRPLFLDFPDDPKCYDLEDQYMFGPDLVVAPIYNYEQRERQVYLPAGNWVLFGHTEAIEGGKTVTMDGNLDQIPAYIRADSPLAAAFAK